MSGETKACHERRRGSSGCNNTGAPTAGTQLRRLTSWKTMPPITGISPKSRVCASSLRLATSWRRRFRISFGRTSRRRRTPPELPRRYTHPAWAKIAALRAWISASGSGRSWRGMVPCFWWRARSRTGTCTGSCWVELEGLSHWRARPRRCSRWCSSGGRTSFWCEMPIGMSDTFC